MAPYCRLASPSLTLDLDVLPSSPVIHTQAMNYLEPRLLSPRPAGGATGTDNEAGGTTEANGAKVRMAGGLLLCVGEQHGQTPQGSYGTCCS